MDRNPNRMLFSLALLLAAPAAALDLGVLAVGEVARRSLPLPHAGPGVLTIAEVTSSCDCLSILSHPRRLAPGETGVIELTIRAEKAGDFRYELRVRPAGAPATERVFYLDLTVTGATAASPSRANRDPTLYLSATALRAALAGDRAPRVVDVRNPDAYADAHLPGAVRLPLFEVKRHAFLRTQGVVLTDDGWGDPALEDECRKLRTLGFASAAILDGGVHAWAALGEPTAGRHAAPGTPWLPAARFLAARHAGDWLVADLGISPTTPRSDSGLLPALRLDAAGLPITDLAALIRGAAAGRPRPARVLVANDTGVYPPEYRAALAAVPNTFVFYLEGGWPDLAARMAASPAVAASSASGGSGQPGVNPAALRPRVKPCGSCP